MKEKQRQSNFELLRILAMLMIITLHYFEKDRQPDSGTVQEIIYIIYRSLAICGVNVFVLLTGYFSLKQDCIKTRKIFNLLLDVAFWEGLGFLLCVVSGSGSFQIKELIRSMFPIIFGGRWFVKAYILLLLLAPFINVVLTSISRRSYQLLLTVQVFLFSLWPFLLPNPPFDDYGFSFVHFITLYTIAGYIRLHMNRIPSKFICALGFVLCFSAVLGCKILGVGYEWAYNSPFVICEAVFLFLYFAQVRIRSKAINTLASCAFGVFLVHTSAYFGQLGYVRLFHADTVVNGNVMILILTVPLCAVFFYLFGFLLESAKKWLFSHSLDRLFDRIPYVNYALRVEVNNDSSHSVHPGTDTELDGGTLRDDSLRQKARGIQK